MAFRENDFLLENFAAVGTFLVLASRLRAGGLFIRYPLKGIGIRREIGLGIGSGAVVGVGLTARKGERAPRAIAANDNRISIFDFFITVSSLSLWIFESLR